MSRLFRQRGDTIVEMVFAFGVLSLVIVGAMMVMNRGVRLSQLSIETSLVRQQIDAQAETIRYLQSTNNPAWDQIKARETRAIMPLSTVPCPSINDIRAGARQSFFVTEKAGSDGEFVVNNIDSSTYSDPATYARIDYSSAKSQGIWVQLARATNTASPSSPGSKVIAYDVYIHACWFGAGTDMPSTLGTIARIYDQS